MVRVNTAVAITASIYSEAGVLVDPQSVTFTVIDPSGNSEIVGAGDSRFSRASLGVYTLRFVVDEAGVWRVQVTAQVPHVVEVYKFYVGGVYE